MVKMVTPTKSYLSPTADAIKSVAFAFIWADANDGGTEVKSAWDWRIIKAACGLHGLTDRNGETRYVLLWGAYHTAIEHSDWAAFDTAIMKTRCEVALSEWKTALDEVELGRKRITLLETVLHDVYRINEQAGPGSRRQVRELIKRVLENAGR